MKAHRIRPEIPGNLLYDFPLSGAVKIILKIPGSSHLIFDRVSYVKKKTTQLKLEQYEIIFSHTILINGISGGTIILFSINETKY